MKQRIVGVVLVVCGGFGVPVASAAPPAGGAGAPYYVGAGGSLNSVSGSDYGLGVQVFGGYDLGSVNAVRFAVEAGYLDTGRMDYSGSVTAPAGSLGSSSARARGLWATGLGRVPVSKDVEILGRLGLDFGDDDGVVVGVGAAFNGNRRTQFRAEFVVRDHVDSIQVNVTYRP